MSHYKVYFHGDYVGTAPADCMTRDEAAVWFANRNPEYPISGLMAVESN